MPLVITKPLDVLPFLRIKQSKKTRQRSAVWHVGPWQYDSATGRHRLKLTRKVRWESRTRAQRTAAKKAHTARRAAERAAWDRFFATRDSAAPAPPPVRTVRARSTAATKPAPGAGTTAVAASVCVFCHTPLVDAMCPRCSGASRAQPRPAGHVEVTQAAGVCGAVTRDGGRCQRTGDCPYHAGSNRRAARDAGTGRETR